MAKYTFTARDIDGKIVDGELDANSQLEALVRLRAQKLVPVRLRQLKNQKVKNFAGGLFAPKVDMKDLQVFTRQFSTLINSGITVLDSLKILSEGLRLGLLKSAASRAAVGIEQGKKLGDALAESPNVFDKLYVNMIKAGEEAGILDNILTRLSVYIEKSEKIKSQIKGAMVFPAVVIFFASLVIIGILVFIMPKFQEFYTSLGSELPWLTQRVIDFSHLLVDRWYVFVGFAIGIPIAIKQYLSTPVGKIQADLIFVRIPVFGELIKKSAIARVTRTLSTLLSSGVGLLDAIDIAARTSGNYVVEKALMRSKESVLAGRPFAAPLSKEKIFPDMVVQMISIGEKSGTLDNMLGKIADFYEDEVETAVKAVTALVEPILMVGIGGAIAILVIAMYLPIFGMADAMSKGMGD